MVRELHWNLSGWDQSWLCWPKQKVGWEFSFEEISWFIKIKAEMEKALASCMWWKWLLYKHKASNEIFKLVLVGGERGERHGLWFGRVLTNLVIIVTSLTTTFLCSMLSVRTGDKDSAMFSVINYCCDNLEFKWGLQLPKDCKDLRRHGLQTLSWKSKDEVHGNKHFIRHVD